MIRKTIQLLLIAVILALAAPAWAETGTAQETDINQVRNITGRTIWEMTTKTRLMPIPHPLVLPLNPVKTDNYAKNTCIWSHPLKQ